MGDWDDEDFEIDVKQLDKKLLTKLDVAAEANEKGAVKEESSSAAPSASVAAKKRGGRDPLRTFGADLDRELTEQEKEQIQKRSDLKLARELFGGDAADELLPYAELETIDDFRSFGESLGDLLNTRANAAHFIEMLMSLLKRIADRTDAVRMRYLSNLLKTMADEKTAAEKKAKVKGAAAKPTMKISQKSALPSKATKALYEDFVADEYDDFADDFM